MLVYQRVKLGKLNLTSIWMWSHLTHFEKHHEWRVDRHFSDREVHIVASWMSILLREHRSTVRPSSFWRQASPLLLVPSQFCLVNVQFWSLVGGFKHFLFFPSYWECHHPNWLYHIFFRGGRLNHQAVKAPCRLYYHEACGSVAGMMVILGINSPKNIPKIDRFRWFHFTLVNYSCL